MQTHRNWTNGHLSLAAPLTGTWCPILIAQIPPSVRHRWDEPSGFIMTSALRQRVGMFSFVVFHLHAQFVVTWRWLNVFSERCSGTEAGTGTGPGHRLRAPELIHSPIVAAFGWPPHPFPFIFRLVLPMRTAAAVGVAAEQHRIRKTPKRKLDWCLLRVRTSKAITVREGVPPDKKSTPGSATGP